MTGAEKHEDHSHHSHANVDPTIYTCPMHPEIRSTSPGTCPKCGMKLVPIAMTERGMDHHGHAMTPASEMSRSEKFRMSMTMTMGMEHTGVAGPRNGEADGHLGLSFSDRYFLPAYSLGKAGQRDHTGGESMTRTEIEESPDQPDTLHKTINTYPTFF